MNRRTNVGVFVEVLKWHPRWQLLSVQLHEKKPALLTEEAPLA